jgi:hypothetical protein
LVFFKLKGFPEITIDKMSILKGKARKGINTELDAVTQNENKAVQNGMDRFL